MVDTIQLQRFSHFFSKTVFPNKIYSPFHFSFIASFIAFYMFFVRNIWSQCVLLVHGALKMCTVEVWTDRSVPRMLFHAIDIYVEQGSCLLSVNSLIFLCMYVCIEFSTLKRRTRKHKTRLNLQMTPLQNSDGCSNKTSLSSTLLIFPLCTSISSGMDSVSNFSIIFSSHPSFYQMLCNHINGARFSKQMMKRKRCFPFQRQTWVFPC